MVGKKTEIHLLFFLLLKDSDSKLENRLIELETAQKLTRPVSRGKSRKLKPLTEHHSMNTWALKTVASI